MVNKPLLMMMMMDALLCLVQQTTMREVLASIPGFHVKSVTKRTTRKLSAAAQIQRTREGCVDLQNPTSILVQANLRGLLNKHTFAGLPPLYQHKLIGLLPEVDRLQSPAPDGSLRIGPTGLSNEFFSRACQVAPRCQFSVQSIGLSGSQLS